MEEGAAHRPSPPSVGAVEEEQRAVLPLLLVAAGGQLGTAKGIFVKLGESRRGLGPGIIHGDAIAFRRRFAEANGIPVISAKTRAGLPGSGEVTRCWWRPAV